jgi:tripeptidyl-peptidase-1
MSGLLLLGHAIFLCNASEKTVSAPIRPSGWRIHTRTVASKKIMLTFALKQQNLANLVAVATAVSDPRNSRYGKHLSRDAINELVAPASQSKAELVAFLTENDIKMEACDNLTDFVRCEVTAGQAEKMLGGEYLDFAHDSGVTASRMLAYTIPERSVTIPTELLN